MNASNFGAQLLTYHTIRIFIGVHGYAPTIDELSQIRHLHFTNVHTHLRQLETRGLITRQRGWRNIRLTARAV